MELDLKPDFEHVRRRWDRYWAGEIDDRPMMALVLPKRGRAPVVMPWSYHLPRLELTEAVDAVYDWASSLEWLGDAIPSYVVSFAPDHLALLMGADLEYADEEVSLTSKPQTAWVHPVLDDYDTEIAFRPDWKWWEETVRIVEALRARCDGSLIVAPTHLQGGLDCLAALRGGLDLLNDMVTRPDDVNCALRQIDRAERDVREAFSDLFDIPTFGSVTRHYMYSRGLVDVPQCDFSALIGPEMFDEFAMPSLCTECADLDHAEYHLDGPGAIRHLPKVASIERIKAVQWVAGAGEAATQDWSDLYEEIDSLGKGQVRHGLKPDAIRELWERCGSRRYLHVASVAELGNVDQAYRFLDSFV